MDMPIRWSLLRLAVAACIATLACGDATATAPPPGTLRVLFIGNSLTETNDLPAMLQALADSADGPDIHVAAVTMSGFSLEDHWDGTDARERIAGAAWDWVVLQQGPSAWPSSRENLREWTRKYAPLIRAAGGEPALYMVWPESWRMTAFDSVRTSYDAAAADVGGALVPGGDAWRAAWRRDGRMALYGGDGFHPSALGTYVVAVTMYARLTGRSPVGLPSTLRVRGEIPWTLAITPDEASIAQHAAVEAVASAR